MPVFTSSTINSFAYREPVFAHHDRSAVDLSIGSGLETSESSHTIVSDGALFSSVDVVVSSNAPYHGGDYFNRIHIIPGTLDLGNLVSDQTQDLIVFNAYRSTKELSAITPSNADGVVISGQAVPYTFASFEELTYQLAISTQGPPQVDATYSFTWTTPEDNYSLSVTGQRIVGLPYQFKAPAKEFLEWETQTILTYDGTDEDAIKLRKVPKQSFDLTYPLSDEIINTVENNVYGWRQRAWSINLWTEAQNVGTLNSGDTFILIDTTIADFRDDSLIFISSPEGGSTVNITTVESDRVNLQIPLTSTYTNAFVMPARIGRITADPVRQTNGFNGEINIKYEVTENDNISVTAPAQYKGYDVYFDDVLMDGGFLQDAYSMRVDVIDFSGKVEFSSPWDKPKVSRPKKTIADGLEEVWAYREWLFRRAGKYRPFWLPTFERNFFPIGSGEIINEIIVKSQLYSQYSSTRSDIAIKMTTGEWITREVTGTTVNNDDTESLLLDANLNRDYNEVVMICYLDLKRLSTDKIELTWNPGQVVESTVGLVDK